MFKNNFINNINLPDNIEIGIKNDLKFNLVYIKGPFGEQILKYPKTINFSIGKVDKKFILSFFFNNINKNLNLKQKDVFNFKSLIENNLISISKNLSFGLEKELIITGVGYRVYLNKEKNLLGFKIGKSHKMYFKIPKGIWIRPISRYNLKLFCGSSFLLNDTIRKIKNIKLPDVYKAKGIRLKNENIKQKEGKKK